MAKRKKKKQETSQNTKTENITIKNFVMQIRIRISERKKKKSASSKKAKNKEKKKQECLKCKYQKLLDEGKEIFDVWDQREKPPKRLIAIQKELIKLKKAIKQEQIDDELQYCAEHAEVFEFLPSEWT